MDWYGTRVLTFAWVLLLRKLVATALIGTYVHRVLVIDRYLYPRVYGMGHMLYTTMFVLAVNIFGRKCVIEVYRMFSIVLI